MNTENLHRLIDRYEENFEVINNAANNEIFKWKAVKCFRDVWFSKEAETVPFAEMFNMAKKESAVLIDNAQVSPTNGIVKLAEKDPIAVERLFKEVLFADDGGDLKIRQNHMDRFIEEIEKLRIKYYPQCWKYKQDRHTVSCYLAFYSPEDNYIYRYSNAETFAQYIEFGIDIGSGDSFKLDAYYQLCDVIVEALKEHKSLLDKHFKLLSESCYRDDSLHLLAFDVMYCAKSYGFFNGLRHIPKKQSVKAYTESQLRAKEQQELQEKVNIINAEITELECKIAVYEDISLLNVKVHQKTYGNGVVIAQNINNITVRFDDCEKMFVINRKFVMRPTFEDDEDIVNAFTEYDEICDKIRKLKAERSRLLSK